MRLVSALFNCFNPFNQWLPDVPCAVIDTASELQKGDILIIWGGRDISPALYNKRLSFMGDGHEVVVGQDKTEWEMLEAAKNLGCPVIGVCRGGQMLTAFNGGYLIQHVDNHAGRYHKITTFDGRSLVVNSAHHQMMMPDKSNHKLLAWTSERLSERYFDENKLVKVDVEPEMIHYYDNNSLAMQWHPEWMIGDCASSEYAKKYFMENIL